MKTESVTSVTTHVTSIPPKNSLSPVDQKSQEVAEKAFVPSSQSNQNEDEALKLYQLAIKYFKGDEVSQDIKAALYLLKEASKRGYTEAQYKLGYLYYFGLYITQDYRLAYDFLQKAGEKGHSEALNLIGNIFYLGLGIGESKAQAKRYYKKAEQLGSSFAAANLESHGPVRRVKLDADLNLGEVNRHPQMDEWLKSFDSQIKTEIDVDDFFAHKGNPLFQSILGSLFEDKRVIVPNLQAAMFWHQQAASRGLLISQVSLGDLFSAEKNYQDACYWYGQAASFGNKDASEKLSFLKNAGVVEFLETPQMVDNSFTYSYVPDQLDHSKKVFYQGRFYTFLGIRQDFPTSYPWLNKVLPSKLVHVFLKQDN